MTVIFDTPTWVTVGAWNIAEMFTLGAMSPWHNNCCGEFPWQYQQPSSGLVIGFGVISLSWHDKMGAWAICHGRCAIMMPRNIAPSVKEPVDFFVTHFQASVMPRHCAAIVMGSNLGWVNWGKARKKNGRSRSWRMWRPKQLTLCVTIYEPRSSRKYFDLWRWNGISLELRRVFVVKM